MVRRILASAVAFLALARALPHGHDRDAQSLLTLEPGLQEYFNVRRYQLSSSSDKDSLLLQAMTHNLDIWSITSDRADIYFPSNVPIPDYFVARNFTLLQASASRTPGSPSYASADIKWNLTSLDSDFHDTYHPLAEIESFSQQLAEEHEDVVNLIKLGRTSEGRDILAISISLKRHRKKQKKRKKRLVIQGAQHAREWIASSTALYLAHSLLVDASSPLSKRGLLDSIDFTIIPMPNPDGYAYTWEHDRLWYKNRADVGGGECKGIDLGRNWGFKWAASTDSDPCSGFYPGTRPFDALETTAIESYIKRTPNIKGFLDLRSYGQKIMHPFSYSCHHRPRDEENLMEAALGAAKAMSSTHGIVVGTGSLCQEQYRAPGNVVDWMYGEIGIGMAYSVLLRDTGTYGFLLPPKWIRPVGEETADMMHYIARWIKKHKGITGSSSD